MKPFDDATIEELARTLGCDHSKATEAAQRIQMAIEGVRNRQSIPAGRVKADQEGLKTLETGLSHGVLALTRILETDPVAFNVEQLAERVGIERADLDQSRSVMRALVLLARFLAENTDAYRLLNYLPTGDEIKPRAKPETEILWPVLFDLWHSSYGKLQYSKNGPLFRFIEFVHKHAGFEPPPNGTLRSAVKRWEPGPELRLETKLLLELRHIYALRDSRG